MASKRLASIASVVDVFNVLGQLFPAQNVLSVLYTVGSVVQTVLSTIVVCNQSGSQGKYRISIGIAGAVDDRSQYLAYDVVINPNDSMFFTVGVTMGPDDELRVQSNNGLMSFTCYGDEIVGMT